MSTNLPISGAFSVTAIYGQAGSYWPNGHKGIDFIDSDKRIFATCDGAVSFTGFDKYWGYYVSIQPNDAKDTRHILCHMVKGSIKVKKGDKVTRDTVIGTMGDTGNVSGVHVHFQINKVVNGKGVAINPCDYLGIPNKKGSYNSKDFEITEKPATTDFKALYDKEVKLHAASKTTLKAEQDKGVKIAKDLTAANSKIAAAKAALQ